MGKICESDTYNLLAAAEKLGLHKKTLRKLSKDGAIPYSSPNRLFVYDAPYINDLAKQWNSLPDMYRRSSDDGFFHLYRLHRVYHAPPPGCSRGQRDKHQKMTKDLCKALVAENKARTAEWVADAIGEKPRTVRKWSLTGKIVAFHIGQTHFLSAGYAAYLVKVFTTWSTIADASNKTGVLIDTIGSKVDRGDIHAIRCPDGLRRIPPEEVKRLVVLTTTESGDRLLTLEEAAQRLGADTVAITGAIHHGILRSVGARQTRRITEAEVRRWEERFSHLNTEFAWLEPHIVQPGAKTLTMEGKHVVKTLGIGMGCVTNWCDAGVLPFFTRSFSGERYIRRAFVRRYILGLRAFAGEGKVARNTAIAYRELCKERGYIV